MSPFLEVSTNICKLFIPTPLVIIFIARKGFFYINLIRIDGIGMLPLYSATHPLIEIHFPNPTPYTFILIPFKFSAFYYCFLLVPSLELLFL